MGGSVELLPNTCQVENKTVGNLARYISVEMMQGIKAARLLFSSENFLLTSLKTQIGVQVWNYLTSCSGNLPTGVGWGYF